TAPSFLTPYVDRQTGFVEKQRFPVKFPPSNVSASNPDSSIDWSFFEPISSSPGFWYKNRVPYAEHYSLSIQRQFGTASVLSVSYVGTQGHRLLSDLEANVGKPALCKAYLARGSRIKRFLHDEETFEYQPLGLEIVVFLWL